MKRNAIEVRLSQLEDYIEGLSLRHQISILKNGRNERRIKRYEA